MKKDYSNGTETKSFIQQRVERLYGPGALAQGFFVTKRQKSRLSECEDNKSGLNSEADKHSKSMTDTLDDDEPEPMMKQSTSSPTLPVLRHLRPEFRAQLPIISPKKGAMEGALQKSVTIPKLKDEIDVTRHAERPSVKLSDLDGCNNGHAPHVPKDDGEFEKSFVSTEMCNIKTSITIRRWIKIRG